ncbi:MAG: circularly permuted type 2 ATP-grasp protein [Actinomycetota bacterium]|nr:circularly permuted type 2 ATP-grasp protein [Actinomycetota bacterium]
MSNTPIDALLGDHDRLLSWRERADRLLEAEGAGHLVHDLPVRSDGRATSAASRPWRLDPIPITLDRAVHEWLASAVAERMRALSVVLDDLHGARTLLRSGVVPADVLFASGAYRSEAVGSAPRRWLTVYAVDLIESADGVWHIVQDLTDAPVGIGYTLLDRSVMTRVAPTEMASAGVTPLHGFADAMRSALASCSTAESPRIVVFSGGLDHPSYVEQAYLSVQLGVNLVEGADLVVRQRRLWIRTLDGLEPVDVVLRRLEDPGIDPLQVDSYGAAGVPGLLSAARAGGVDLANAFGCGVIEALGRSGHLESAIAAMAPIGAALAPMPADTKVRLFPMVGDDGPHEAPVVVRMFAVDDGERVTVLPGGSGRVLAPGDDPREPTAGVAKDVWALRVPVRPVQRRSLPQVDFGSSVPTRVADSLYWMNRSAERAEAIARLMRTITSSFDQDPGLLEADGERRPSIAAALLRSVTTPFVGGEPEHDGLADHAAAVAGATRELTRQIGSLMSEAITVREYLSATGGRLLAHLASIRASLTHDRPDVEQLDSLLADFAALAGLWNESTVRGPAWRIGDLGRRLERAALTRRLVVTGLTPGAGEPLGVGGPESWAAEITLAACESLVAYRRRHRSEVERRAAVAILIEDESNPRSLRHAITAVQRHAAAIGWTDGVAITERLSGAIDLTGVADELAALDSSVVSRWFSAPTHPVPLFGALR